MKLYEVLSDTRQARFRLSKRISQQDPKNSEIKPTLCVFRK